MTSLSLKLLLSIFAAVLLFTACKKEDTPTTPDLCYPEITILSPAPDTVIVAGQPFTLKARVDNIDNGYIFAYYIQQVGPYQQVMFWDDSNRPSGHTFSYTWTNNLTPGVKLELVAYATDVSGRVFGKKVKLSIGN